MMVFLMSHYGNLVRTFFEHGSSRGVQIPASSGDGGRLTVFIIVDIRG